MQESSTTPQNASVSAQGKSRIQPSTTEGSAPAKSVAGTDAVVVTAGGTGPSIEALRKLIPKGIHFKKTVRGAVRSIGYKTKPKYPRWKKSRYPGYRRRSFYRRRYY